MRIHQNRPSYEPRDTPKFEYGWQWAYQDRFKEAGIMALLGSGFDPGVTSVFASYIKKLDSIDNDLILDLGKNLLSEHMIIFVGQL